MHAPRRSGWILRLLTILIVLVPLLPLAPALRAAGETIGTTPASGPPGTVVLVQGSGFSYIGAGPVAIWWDRQMRGVQIGSGTMNTDGTFAISVIIPLGASVATHQITAEYYGYTGGYVSATTDFKVVAPSTKIAYIYDSDGASAKVYESFVEATGMASCDLLSLQAIAEVDLASYSLILVADDTGDLDDWGNDSARWAIIRSGRPVLGIGEGGYAYFGALQLAIGHPHGAHSSQVTDLWPADLQHSIYQQPFGGFNLPISVYETPTSCVSIHLDSEKAGVARLGRLAAESLHYPVVQQSVRYVLWGYTGAPSTMTSTGERLFANLLWYMLRFDFDVDTLILTDTQRMRDIGYLAADVSTLETALNDLVAEPVSVSNMTAVMRRLDADLPAAGLSERAAWAADVESVAATNDYVQAIDDYIESQKQGAYPSLLYVIFVGAHEVIPMKARDTDDMDTPYRESQWASGLPQTSGYLYALYHDPGVNNLGHYLTDSIYGDLSYIDNGLGVDNELVPELAVGRLVETPLQIETLIRNYIDSQATLQRSELVSIASNDYLDGGMCAAGHMGLSCDTSLVLNTFDTNLVPPLLNGLNEIVYIGGHGAYNSISPGFKAGASATHGDTEELDPMPDAVVVTSGCHNGVNFGNRLYHDYTGNTTYGEFPERFAAKEVGVYLGATGYTWISGSGTSTNPAYTGWNELLATHFLDHLMNDGLATTVGKAFKDAVNDYVADYGGVGNPHRRVLAIATVYGIPNYRWPTFHLLPRPPIEFAVHRIWEDWPPRLIDSQPVQPWEHIVFEVNDWAIDPSGVVEIGGLAQVGDHDEPILPRAHLYRVLPSDSAIISVTLLMTDTAYFTVTNDIPLASMAVGAHTVQNTFTATEPYPSSLVYTSTLPAEGGEGTRVGLHIVPVQYDPTSHETRIWTRLAMDVKYELDESALGADSDNDGLPNYWEIGYGLDPNSGSGDDGAEGDPDADGLPNDDEYLNGTDPMHPDSDGDGATDGEEVDAGTDPLDPADSPPQPTPTPPPGTLYLPLVARE